MLRVCCGVLLLLVGCRSSELPSCPSGPHAVSGAAPLARVEVVFQSVAPYPLELLWVNQRGQEVQSQELTPGGTATRHSTIGHVFRARQRVTRQLLMEYTVSKPEHVLIHTCAQAHAQIGRATIGFALPAAEIQALVHDQAAPCTGKSSAKWSCVRTLSAADLAGRAPSEYGFQEADQLHSEKGCAERKVHDTTDYGYSNKAHRMAVPRVTAGPGFLKMSVLPELALLLRQWAANHSQHWTQGVQAHPGYQPARSIPGCYTNTHACPVSQLNLDHFSGIRERIVRDMHGVLEWWCAAQLLHAQTFGMRIYHRDSLLINHVDREHTHICSAVIQVLQEADEDGGWPLEVLSEDGTVHEVYLQPGEMVLYEGAKLMHGRPMRFKGEHFGNIFTHFQPWTKQQQDQARKQEL